MTEKEKEIKVAIIGGMYGLAAALRLRSDELDIIAQSGLDAYEIKKQFDKDVNAACFPERGRGKGDRVRRRQQWIKK